MAKTGRAFDFTKPEGSEIIFAPTNINILSMNLRWRCAQFFELRWWKNYLNSRDKSEYLRWKKTYWLDFLKNSGLRLLPGAGVLDAGCGPAGIFTVLYDYKVDAVDPLLDQYAGMLPHFQPADYPYVRFFSQTLESFSPAKRYDVVFCLNAINHVANLDSSLDRLVALVQPGGYLLLSVDAHNYHWIRYLFQRLPADILHPHQFTCTEYAKMLRTRGLGIERTILIKKSGIFNYYLFVARAALPANPAIRASDSA